MSKFDAVYGDKSMVNIVFETEKIERRPMMVSKILAKVRFQNQLVYGLLTIH